MTTAVHRLLIFGLACNDSADDVRVLLGCAASSVEIVDVPGGAGQAYAVVAMPDRQRAARVAWRVGQRRRHGRSLQSWLPVMAWQ